MVVLCGGIESELCVPTPKFQDDAKKVLWTLMVSLTYSPSHIAETFGFEDLRSIGEPIRSYPSEHTLPPNSRFPDLTDTPRSLQNFQGKKTFLYVWGSW